MPKSIAPLAPRAERSTKSASILLLLLLQATKHLHTARDARRARHNRQAAARPARRDKLHVVLSHQSLPVTHPAEFLAMDLLLAAATCSNQLFVAAADVPPAARTTQRHQGHVDVTICTAGAVYAALPGRPQPCPTSQLVRHSQPAPAALPCRSPARHRESLGGRSARLAQHDEAARSQQPAGQPQPRRGGAFEQQRLS